MTKEEIYAQPSDCLLPESLCNDIKVLLKQSVSYKNIFGMSSSIKHKPKYGYSIINAACGIAPITFGQLRDLLEMNDLIEEYFCKDCKIQGRL